MWDWHINDQLSFTNAARVDHWQSERDGGITVDDTVAGITTASADQENTEFSFNSGLVYQVSNTDTIRLSAARGLHIPSLDEMAIDIGVVPGAEYYGNPHLDTESTTLFELGYNHTIPDQNIKLGTNLFYERIESIIAPTIHNLGLLGGTGGAEADLTFENAGDADAYGIEILAKGFLLNNALPLARKLHVPPRPG